MPSDRVKMYDSFSAFECFVAFVVTRLGSGYDREPLSHGDLPAHLSTLSLPS